MLINTKYRVRLFSLENDFSIHSSILKLFPLFAQEYYKLFAHVLEVQTFENYFTFISIMKIFYNLLPIKGLIIS